MKIVGVPQIYYVKLLNCLLSVSISSSLINLIALSNYFSADGTFWFWSLSDHQFLSTRVTKLTASTGNEGGRVILTGESASRRPICKLVSSNDSQIFSKRSQKLGCLVPTLLFQRALKKDQINFQLVVNIIHLNTHFQLSTALLVRTSLPNTDSTSRRWITQVFSIYVFNCLNLPLYPCPTSTGNIFS